MQSGYVQNTAEVQANIEQCLTAILLKFLPSCLAKADVLESVFVLRAQDKLAAALVEEWSRRADAYGAPEKATDARQIAVAMFAWPTRKYPD